MFVNKHNFVELLISKYNNLRYVEFNNERIN